jgi:hypothetical protein
MPCWWEVMRLTPRPSRWLCQGIARNAGCVVRGPRAGARLRKGQESGWFVSLATVGVRAYAVTLPLVQLYRIVSGPIDQNAQLPAGSDPVVPAGAGLAGVVGRSGCLGTTTAMGPGGDGGVDHRRGGGGPP